MRQPREQWVLVGLVASILLLFVAVAAERGVVVEVDSRVHGIGFEQRWPDWSTLANLVEVIGQRGIVYPIAFLLTGVMAWSVRRWRPLVLLGGSLLALNATVGAGKLLIGRQKPFYGDVDLFNGGNIFPSGHAANVVLVWGLLAYLFVHHGGRSTHRRLMVPTVVAAALAMGAASIYLDTHWVSDILAGWLMGATILQTAVMLDRRWTTEAPTSAHHAFHRAPDDRAPVPARRAE